MKLLPEITDRPVRLGILISGGGRTMLNLADRIQDGSLSAEIPLVLASRSNCAGIDRARAAGLVCEPLLRRDFDSVESFSDAVFDRMRERSVDLVVMAGFLCLVTIPDDFALRVLNIHPSLIPAFSGQGFYGTRVHQAAIERGVRVSGCTVHFADNEYDHGPIIVQQAVAIPDQATPEQLAALVFEQEQAAYPEAIRRVASGRLHIDGQRAIMLPDS
ncbi:MAG: phosphoribosylglycinamide formyltransferase [Fuerstiella sp.]|nr:phosphoribosylglycinamide formyltransferase [Fuerstiella sp.]